MNKNHQYDCELGVLVSKFSIYDRFDQNIDIGVNIRMLELSALLSLSIFECIEEINSIVS